jgi:membrane associated rhomboid family serine protease
MAYTRGTWADQYGSSRYYRPSLFGGFSFFPPVIKALLIANVGVFLFFLLFGAVHIQGVSIAYLLDSLFALFPLGSNFYPWQLFTYLFIHGGFLHLFFNMFALWMFGMEVENTWGSKKFLTYYLICGVGAGLSNLFIAPLFGSTGPTVGASGAIYGVLLAFGLMFPNRYIFLFPFFVPIKSKYFVAGYILLEVFSGVTGTSDGVAHFAHLGGAAVGYIYMLIDAHRLPFEGVFSHVASALSSGIGRRTMPPSRMYRDVTDAQFTDVHEPRTKSEQDINQEKIDAILDKISVSGYQSLTDEEKRMLFDASKKMN